MPRNKFSVYSRSQFKWDKHQRDDDRPDGGGDYLHRKERGGRFGGRRSGGNGTNLETIKRAIEMNQHSGAAGSVSYSVQNTGLCPGEIWIRITVIFGGSYAINILEELVNNTIGASLRFYNSRVEGRNVLMYAKIRQKDLSNYRRSLASLRAPDEGTNLNCDITAIPEPFVPVVYCQPTILADGSRGPSSVLSENCVLALRNCFLQRFQSTTRNLDLSNLHSDPVLLSQGLYLPLNKQPVIYALINILKESQAQLALLNLSSNRLPSLAHFSALSVPTPGLTQVSIERIDLSSNPLSGFPALTGLSNISGLVELDLTETPLVKRFQQNEEILVAKIQRILPNLKRLNGRDLAQKITFAVERESNSKLDHPNRKPLPQSIQGYFPSEDVRLPVLSFLKTYFFRYDSRPRGENLLPYYTSASQFVYSVSAEIKAGQINPSTARLEVPGPNGELSKIYLTTARLSGLNLMKSRNLLRCHDENRRRDSVFRGSLAIAAFLDEFPATEHVLESLCVDVVFHSPTQLLLTVSGVFFELHAIKSTSSTSSPGTSTPVTRKILRCFSRTMILVAPGDHILQDDLIIANPTPSVCKKYIIDAATRQQQQQQEQQPLPQPQLPGPEQVRSTSSQDVILSEFRQRTGMNMNFARQCLQEYNWDVNAAWAAFETMHAAGKIPAAAFS